MSARRRTNLSRSTAEARRKRLLRASETSAQRQGRLKAQRERNSSHRASETAEQRKERREVDRRRKARYAAAKRELKRAANRKRVTQLLESGSPLGELDHGDEGMRKFGDESTGRCEQRLGKTARRKKRPAACRKRNSLPNELAQRFVKASRKCNPLGLLPSASDPEVFVKSAVRQWFDKVKRQVNVACSRATIKKEVPDEDEATIGEEFGVDDVTLPKTELPDEEEPTTEVNAAALPDQVPKPLEMFVNVSTKCSIGLRMDVKPLLESDPLDVGVESKPLVDSSPCCPVISDVVSLKGVKQEFGGPSEDGSSAAKISSVNEDLTEDPCGTASPAAVMLRRRRAPAPPPDDEKAQQRLEKRRAAQREYQRGRRSNLRPSQQRALREKHRLYRRRLREAHRLAALAAAQSEVPVLDSDGQQAVKS